MVTNLMAYVTFLCPNKREKNGIIRTIFMQKEKLFLLLLQKGESATNKTENQEYTCRGFNKV